MPDYQKMQGFLDTATGALGQLKSMLYVAANLNAPVAPPIAPVAPTPPPVAPPVPPRPVPLAAGGKTISLDVTLPAEQSDVRHYTTGFQVADALVVKFVAPPANAALAYSVGLVQTGAATTGPAWMRDAALSTVPLDSGPGLWRQTCVPGFACRFGVGARGQPLNLVAGAVYYLTVRNRAGDASRYQSLDVVISVGANNC